MCQIRHASSHITVFHVEPPTGPSMHCARYNTTDAMKLLIRSINLSASMKHAPTTTKRAVWKKKNVIRIPESIVCASVKHNLMKARRSQNICFATSKFHEEGHGTAFTQAHWRSECSHKNQEMRTALSDDMRVPSPLAATLNDF